MTYLIDTSAWVEYFRRTESFADLTVTRLVTEQALAIVGCSPVRLELSLESNELRRRRLLKAFDAFRFAPISDDDFDLAGDIYRATRATGHTPRAVNDCLIAAIAFRNDCQLVHNDVDFDRISAAVPELSVLRLPNS